MAKFQKGTSGNVGGRPRGYGDLRELARAHTGDALNVLLQVMSDSAAAPSARVSAADSILSRGWGRPELPISARVDKTAEIDDRLRRDLSSLIARVVETPPENKRETGAAPITDGEAEDGSPTSLTH